MPENTEQGYKLLMNTYAIENTHIVVSSPHSFEAVIEALESLLGGVPSPERVASLFYELVNANASWQQISQKVESLLGPGGFMCMLKIDLGSLLSLQGRKKLSIRYVIGNPLIATQMIEHNSEAGLYVPLNLLVYKDEGGQTKIVYDQPSSLMAQFHNQDITIVAQMLDKKLAEFIAQAV